MHAPLRRFAIALTALVAVACTRASHDDDAPVVRTPSVTLSGAGATFPYPLYTRWFSDFTATGDARIDYRAIGSGDGIRALLDGTTDFAATDVPPDTAQRRRFAAMGVRMVPLVVGGAAVTYHVPGLARQLRLDGEVLAAIYRGTVTRWNDPRLVAINPDIALPAQPIVVVTRADTSGTSWILTDFLTRLSPEWAREHGRSAHPDWTVGRTVRGNEGVAAELKVTEYSLGTVEATYAMLNRLPVARIRNHAGAWVTPQAGALRAAASAMLTSLDDTLEFVASITDAPGDLSYPIASLSWLAVPSRGRDTVRVAATTRFVQWALAHGGDGALALGYAPLPQPMRATVMRTWGARER